jgi:hypothetical protein
VSGACTFVCLFAWSVKILRDSMLACCVYSRGCLCEDLERQRADVFLDLVDLSVSA